MSTSSAFAGDFSIARKMSLSAARIHTLPPPMPRVALLCTGYPYTKCVSLHRFRPEKTSVQAFTSGSLVAHISPVRRTVVLKGLEIGFDPLQTRRTIGRTSVSNASCGVAETQTMTRKSSSATIVFPPGKEMLPMLDDGGSGFRGHGYTPYYRGDGSGGGGGGGGFPSSGEFPWGDYWFYIFLFLLRFLIMNMIGEGSCVYKRKDGRNKPIWIY